ncbi:hypothetical protein [Microscilla marina]|uniref:Uncharacterized protein n=1 Tax=Microscilla marina ATCC 23134 TaxID=313606 RepID=A1ZCE7_MICM2|nr:hypothetical protein [Microscilla marina]EAY31949.1 hypothetical protein M23134_01978 [Microscilla marina ATCC 23134]
MLLITTYDKISNTIKPQIYESIYHTLPTPPLFTHFWQKTPAESNAPTK